jgi:periplasmic copper chaperone A
MGFATKRWRQTRTVFFWSLILLSALAGAHEYYARTFKIIHPWALPTAIEARSAEVYLRFEEISEDDRLISASSPFAGRVIFVGEIGQTIDSIELRKEIENELRPGGVHLELRDLTVPLQHERSYPLTLVFEKNGRIDTEISIGAH